MNGLRRALVAPIVGLFALAASMVPASGGTVFAADLIWPPPLPSNAESTLSGDNCGSGGIPVVDVTYVILNMADTNRFGDVWAMAPSTTASLRIWEIPGGSFFGRETKTSYCALIQVVGQFETVAGKSPMQSGNVAGGLPGKYINRIRYGSISGTFTPTYPTTGDLGQFDAQCGADGSCAGTIPSIARYFGSGQRFTATHQFNDYYLDAATLENRESHTLTEVYAGEGYWAGYGDIVPGSKGVGLWALGPIPVKDGLVQGQPIALTWAIFRSENG